MPFDEWYDDATREAATARVLQRRMTNPTDRNVLTVVAEEFRVPRQTLSDWVDEASPESAKPQRKPRPKFSQVVKTTKEARVEPPETDGPAETPRSAAPSEPAIGPESDAPPQTESEVEPELDAAPQAEVAPDADPEPDPWATSDPEPDPWATSDPEPDPWAASDPAPEPEPEPETAPDGDPEPQPEPAPAVETAPAPADGRLTALEAEVAALRAGNRALVEALRVLVDD